MDRLSHSFNLIGSQTGIFCDSFQCELLNVFSEFSKPAGALFNERIVQPVVLDEDSGNAVQQ